MKIITQLFLILILLGGKQVAMAHAVWIESKASASKNQPHDVKIFYGEYASGEKKVQINGTLISNIWKYG